MATTAPSDHGPDNNSNVRRSEGTMATGSTYGSLGTTTTTEQRNKDTSRTEDKINGPRPRRGRHTNAYIYCSHFLSAWGDRMWSFGVGLFLVRIADDQLQLPAIYGLTSGLAIFLLGALVGDWVDSTPRLRAAQVSLVLQNLLVVVCSGGVYAYIRWEARIQAEPGGWAVPLCHGLVIVLAVLADLASTARVIAVEKDWVVKICGEDHDLLAKMTATLRRIDQTTLILAPVATGQVMTFAGMEVGALFIGVWNLASVVLEYYLMWKVYSSVPALAEKVTSGKPPPSSVAVRNEEETPLMRDKDDEHPVASSSGVSGVVSRETSLSAAHPGAEETGPQDRAEDGGGMVVTTTPQRNEFSKSFKADLVVTLEADTEVVLTDDSVEGPQGPGGRSEGGGGGGSQDPTSQRGCCGRGCYRLRALYEGWRLYTKYTVALAGLALSFLYMTVLGFDNITVAYCVTQGVSESILGIMMALSACVGMVGTFIYPIWRRRVGLVRTGMLALSCQVACLSLCVVSIWMPGSPFDPTYSKVPAADNATVGPISPTWDPAVQTTPGSTPRTPTSLPTLSDVTTASTPALVTSPGSSASSEWTGPATTTTTTTLTSTFFENDTTATTLPLTTRSVGPTTGLSTSEPPSTSRSTTPSQDGQATTSASRIAPDLISSPRNVQAGLTTPEDLTSPTNTAATSTTTTTTSAGSSADPASPSFQSSRGSQGGDSTATTQVDTEGTEGSSPGVTAVTMVSSPSGQPGSEGQPSSYLSVSLFIGGIVLARFGLWTADLAITQQFLEAVREGERGAVNGVQNSLNRLLDVLKFLLVVLVPDVQTFGFLILVSFAFICAAWLLYAVFLTKVRGHFFHRGLKCGGGRGADADYARISGREGE